MKKIDLVLILVAFGILFVCCVVAYKVLTNYELFSNDPLVYGAIVWNIESCYCSTYDGKQIDFNQEVVHITKKGNKESIGLQNFSINYSEYIH